MGVVFGANSLVTARAAGNTVVDPDTTNVWNQIAASSTSTQNIGRIWTDKSVFDNDYKFDSDSPLSEQDVKIGDSDFLVSLSALSSTSNLKTTTTSTKPLDIVLVVDTSGSMDNDDGHDMGYSYTPTYNVRTSRTYYIQIDGRWTAVDHNNQGWYYGNYGNRTYVDYARYEGDTSNNRVQFYTRSNQQMSRMEALQKAANAFVDSVASMNDNIAETSQQHRISLVKFASDENNSIGNDTDRNGYNYSQVVSDLTAYTTQSASGLKNTINHLQGEGATRADYGMHQAQRVLDGEGSLTGAREEAQKVVIFFTDGNPTTSSSWSNSVAGTAINYAYDMKQDGTLVYSIGVFEDANPSDTGSNFNRYMNAVSSNYPDAECAVNVNVGEWWNPQYEWRQTNDYSDLVLGDREQGAEGEEAPQYYFAATNATELDQVFDDITTSITNTSGSGSPIEEVTQEGAVNPGTLTFTDTLGSYMTVSGDTMTVVYGDKKFTSTNKTTLDNVDTYHFEGKVAGNDVYKESDLADLTVTVTHGSNLATGDVVTAKIPASLIPMRNYNVDTNEKTMTVTNAYPIRLFFGVSLKDNAKKAIEQGSGDVYDAIVESNKTDDGNATFYSNLFTNGSGDTTASFTPSDGNKFYYYTSDTALYLDEQCSQRATLDNINGHNTLYYSEPYWEITSDTSAQEVTQGIAIKKSGQDWEEIKYDRWGNAYIPAGTQRLDRPSTLNKDKEKNETGTATTVLTPEWDGTAVSQHLGNNGKIAFPLPGELEIKKTVDWGNASDETKQNQNSFTFTVNFNGDETLSGSFAYDIYATGEEPVDNGAVADGGTITLKDGQRAVIKGLPTGTTFTVTETGANKNGFTTTDTVTADPENDTTDGVANGTIVGGSQQSVSFQNNYKADEPVKLGTKTGLKAKKTLTGRDWRESDEFSFQITQIDNGAPTVQMDDPTKIDITQQTDQQTASFGDITFSESGQYRFRVEELSDTDQGITPIAGIDYSGAIYRVTVDVADAGQGALKVSSVLIEQMTNDDGGQGSGVVQGDTMTFTNKYVVGQASETLQGTKIYTDTTDGNKIDAGKFSFQLEALGGYETGTAEGDAQHEDYTIAADSDAMPKPAGMTGTTLETGNVGDTFQFPTIYFDGNDVGKTFEYRITELPHKYQGNAELGMTYDTNTSYVVKIVVTEEQDPDSEDQKAVIKAEPSLQPSEITFTNTYEPTPAKLEGNTAIHGTKTLDGRKMKEGESFYFQLSASNDNAKTVLASPKTVTVSSQDEMGFSFGDMTFTKVGEYVFTVNEVADTNGAETADGSGMTFDKSIYTVTVNVTDEKDGSLKADVTYKKDDGTSADEAAFTNVYTATHDYGDGAQGGIVVTKMMSGRELLDGEFSFTIKGMDQESEALLAGSDRSFTNRAQTVDAYYRMSKLTDITFDQDDAGKTFKFIVDEIEPEADMLAGVRCDQSQFEVDITVVDNGDGTMHTVTTVTQTKAQNGDEANKIIVSAEKGDSSKDDYEAPAFGFQNHYEPTPAVVSDDLENALQVTKKVEGAPSPDGVSYTFTLTATNENGHQNDIESLDENNQITVTTSGVIEEGKTQTLNFGELRFTEPGDYDFEVSEVEPAADDGWTYDTDKKTITVSVTAVNPEWTANPDGGAQKYDGHLYIDSVMGNNPTFTNRYQADPVVVGGEDAEDKITVKKSVTGADSTAEFKFKIEPVIDDDHTEKWWIERVSGAEGFNPEVSISGVTQGQAGTVNFGGIVFKAKGVYEFTIAELGAADFNAGENRNGWTYDEHKATVTVTVTDTDYDGKLEAEVSYDNASATTEADKAETTVAAFTNKYTATPAVLEGNTALGVQKIVSGADTDVDFTFSATFNANAEDNTGSADNIEGLVDGKLTVDITDDFADGDTKSADFGTVKFTAPGIYVFDVTEDNTADENSHWTYDGSTYQIKVTVTDNGQGALVASVDGNDPLFRNTYYNEGEAKDVTSNNGNGSFAGVGDELTYTIDWVNNAVNESGAPVAARITITDVVPAGTEFVSAENNGSNENGTVTWNLGEKQPGDKGTVSFTVKVTEAAVSAGSVENTATVNIGENNPKQTNTVTTDTPKKTATLPETDTNGIQVGDELTFTIDYLNSSNETGTVTVTDVLNDSLTYVGVPEGAAEPQQDGQTLTWTIEDVEAGKGGTITFTAKVNEKATTVSVDNKATVTVGENTYTSNTTTNGKVPTGELNVSKTVKAIGATVDTQKDFTFTITLTGTDGTPLTGTYTYAVADGAEQDLSFAGGSATITLKHGQTAKISGLPQGATYSVVESPAGTVYSTVSENANGTVSDTAATATFTNTYKPGETTYNPSGTANVAVTKNVTGNGAAEQLTKAGYSFQFSVENVSDGAQPTDGFTMPEDATGTSNADGTVTFNDISFNAVGTYEISVWEIAPADDDTEKPGVQSNNVTYDQHKLVYTLNVTDDDHNGTLDFAVAEGSVSTNENVFTNVFFDEETAKSVTSENAAGDKGDGSMASVGDKLTYTINWVNNAVDDNGTPQAATVVVKDTIPEHTTLDESTLDGGVYDAETRTITWTFENQPVGATGTITFTVTVDESAAGTDVQNNATVTVGENDYTTNTVTTTIPGKDVAPAEGDENGIQVGDILTYTIDYANTTDAAATVTVVDTLPDGLTYVDETGDTPTPVIEGQKLTWTIADVPAGTKGELTFTARVNENALTVENPLDNTATIKVGNNTYTTDTTTGEKPETGNLTVSKTVVANGGATIDANKSFSFKIELKDAGGNILTGSYKANVYQGEQQVGTADFIVSGADNAETTERDETTFTLKHGEHIVISGLPEGATYTVTEAAPGAGYVATSENASGTIATEGASAAFTNTYTPGGVTLGDDSAIQVIKKVTGASATEDFTFSIALDENNEGPEDGVTLPENKTATVSKDSLQLAENANEASASAAFGAISFTKAGTYTFVIDETNADPANDSGWTYDQGVCTVTVRVDNDYATGSLKIGDVQYYDHGTAADAATFTNSYKAGSITTGEDDLANLQVTKVVTGAPAAEEFSFELRPAEDYGTKVTGLNNGALTVSTNQMTDQSDPQTLTFGDLTFNEEGTYVFNVTETTDDAAEGSGWTYDNDAAEQITVVVTDPDKDGKLNATTVVDEKDTNNPTFTNVYVPAEVTVGDDEAGLQVTKNVTGAPATEEFQFTLQLKSDNAAYVKGLGANNSIVMSTTGLTGTQGTETVDFGDLTFTKTGDYIFTVTENTTTDAAGWTYDNAPKTITVHVTDEGFDGQLDATVEGNDNLTVTNRYESGSTTYDPTGEAGVAVTKVVTGNGTDEQMSPAGYDFTIGVKNVTDPENPTDEGFSLPNPATGTSDADGAVAFGNITFSKAGDYEVTVSEVNGGKTNVTYDTHSLVYTLHVTDTDYDGYLEVAVDEGTVDEGEATFTNVYYDEDDVKDVTSNNGDGSMAGVGDKLTYTVDWANNALDQSGDPATATVKVTDVVPAGTTVDADSISDGGVYDEQTRTITWTFENQAFGACGTVSFSVTVDEAAAGTTVTNEANVFVNDAQVTTNPVETVVPGKTATDATPDNGLQVGDVIDFTISYGNATDAAADVTVVDTLPAGLTFVGVTGETAEPTIEGQKLTWTFEGMGPGTTGTITFQARVNESATTVENPVDNTAYVTVGDNTFETNTTGDGEKPQVGNLTVSKTVVPAEGTQIDTNKSFSFTLTLKDTAGNDLTGAYAAQLYAGDEVMGEPTTMTSGSTFELKHGQSIKISGLPEGATYTVTEAATDGYTADAATMNGTIPTGEDNASASFTNTYAVTPTTLSGAVNLNVVKNLEGRSWLDTDEFSFVLAADEANPAGATLPEQTELTIAGNTEGHTASFGDITFTQPGTFTFTVTEQPSTVAGVTNDANATRTIVVSVVDNHDGTMTATVDAENSDDLVFTNTFETTPVTLSGDSAIKVQKTLAGRDWTDGETFEFTLAAASEGAPMPESAKLTIDEPTTGSVNTAAFGDMTFTQPGTYVYTISETAGEDATISYDGHTAEVTVAVFQGGNGHDANELWAQVSYNNGTATNEADQAVTGAAAFTNTQGLENKVELTGTKEITGRDFIEGDAFTFTVTGEDDAPMPDGVDENGSVTINPTEGSKATIDFGAITFTEAGEYVYHVAEAEGTIDGMTYDTARRDVIITVTDDGLGNLSAQITSGADQLAWTNAWAFQGATFAELNGTKTMSGKELKNGQFTFLVQPQDNAPMGDTLPANFNGDATQNEDGTWTAPVSLLSNIAFDEAGDYVYVISEVNDGQPGVTYDGTQYRVTLSVANDGTVSQKIEQAENGTDWTDATAVAFANSYATDEEATLEGAVNLTGTKTLQGRDWLDDDSFTFLLAQTEGNKDAVRMPAETAVVVQGNYSDGAAVPFAFGDIVFTEAGDYAFTISEQQPGSDGFVGNTGGMTYDDHVVTISVSVADNGEGKLEATVTGVDGNNNWTNVYKAGGEDKPGILSGAENLVVTKVIEGREWLDTDAFTFTLAADESNPDGVTMPTETTLTINASSENHQAAFGDITFANPGNYKFTVTETAGDIEGMTYDTTAHVVEVSVVDNEDGTLTASVVSPIVAKDLTFTNTYEPTGEVVVEPTEGEFQLTKVLEGKKWDGDEFTFELTGKMGQAADGALIRPNSGAFPMPAETTVTVSAANGTDASGNDQATFGFGPITYAAAGTYTYEVREVAGDNAGMTYDNHVATVTVTVTDNLHGGYVAAVSISGGEFKNTYHTELDYNAEGKGGLWILKNLENHDIADGQFEFTVTAADDASAAKAGFDGMSKVVKSAAGTVDATAEGKQVATSAAEVFGSMQFTQDDADDTYTYTVAETKGGAEGYTNDETVYTVTITTADDGQGTLEVTTHVVGGSIDQTFVYDNDATTEDAQVVVPFNNSYQASGTFDGDGEGAVRINATKELVNAQMNGGEFTFNVTDAQGNVVSSATNAADGSIDFSAIEFTKDGMLNDAENLLASYEKVDGKDTFTYQYTVSEDTTALPAGVTANVTSFSIKVVVTDNNDGTLSFSVVYPEGTEGLAFKNTYGTTETGAASLNVAGTKTLKTAEPGLTAPDITGSYTFTLTGSEGAPMPEVTTATNDAAGNVTFGEIVYTIENVFADDLLAEDEPVEGEGDATEGDAVDTQALEPRSKTFTYTVEESGEVAGVTNDANATRTFTVVVTDNADGTLSVTDGEGNAIQGGLTFDFVNTYSVTPTDPTDPTDPDPTDPSGAAWLTITKALTGRELNEGEFTFALEGVRGTASEGMSLTATNDANGNVTFADGLTFTRPGAYGFTIHEVKGELGGVTYDGAVYTATAQVTDNSNGTLSVTWLGADVDQSPVDAVTFNNTYTVKPTSVVLGGTKVLDGRELSAGEFSFQLADKDGKVIDTAANGEDGTFAFTSVEFDEAGVYEYVISEIVPEDTDAKTAGVQKDNVTYDETSFSVKVTVTDDGQGNLSVSEVTYNGDVKLPVFTNVYVEPEPAPEPEQPAKPEEPAKPEKPAEPEKPSKTPLPQAGDGTSAAFATALLAGGAALVAKALALVKRRDD